MAAASVSHPYIRFTSIRFRNFKAFRNYSVSLSRMNVLVGPNNSGKSTIIGAFRVLAAGLQKASVRSPERLDGPGGGLRYGYVVPEEAIPISMENAQTDYDESTDTTVTFRISTGSELILFFPPGRRCFLFTNAEGRNLTNPTSFRGVYPISVGVVPVLGPLEHEEPHVEDETVRRNLSTHRASRHFRNYWLRASKEEFEGFRDMLRNSWPDIDIKPPIIANPFEPGAAPFLAMFCDEKRIERELFWAGFGFQVWCQLLTHILRATSATIVVIDEPEIYLHPDLQRQLLSILRDLGPDVLVATHSSEIVSQVEPADLLLVAKTGQSARRVGGIEGVRSALERLGSIQNVALTQLARTRRVLFVEGDDFSILARFAKRLALPSLAGGAELAVFPTGGFAKTDSLRSVRDGIRKALGVEVAFAGVFDRDYRCTEEVEAVLQELSELLTVRHVLLRKELENYLLVPSVLERAIEHARLERSRRSGTVTQAVKVDVVQLLREVTDELRIDVVSQYTTNKMDYLRKVSPRLSPATVMSNTTREVEQQWSNLETRIELVPGKETLTRLNARLQETYSVSLTPRAIVDEFRAGEVPTELSVLLRELDAFCRRQVA